MTTTIDPPTPDVAEAPRLKTCPECQQVHDGFFTFCGNCLEARAAEQREKEKREAKQDRVKAWLDLCPPEYRSTNWSHPDLSPVCREVAKRWWAGAGAHLWLGIHGPTGRGKTRAMWEVIRRHHFTGRHCMAVDSTEFASAAGDWFSDDKTAKQAARRLIERAKTCGLLLFDDIGKERLSSTVASRLHELLETRKRERRPLLWTSEKTGDDLAQRFGSDYADGIIRRLRECSEIHGVEVGEG